MSTIIEHEGSFVQTRTQNIYTALSSSSNGTALTELDIVITPLKAGNIVDIEFYIFGEGGEGVGFLVTRNGIRLPDASNIANNRWAITGLNPFGFGTVTKDPRVNVVRLTDYTSLSVASTYSVSIRSTWATNRTFYLNRSVAGTGGNDQENGVSTSFIQEYDT